MKLVYLANIRIPTQRAHGYQIMKMCEEFVEQGIEVKLVVPNKKNYLRQDPFDYYGLTRNFSVRRLPAVDFLGRKERTSSLFFWLDYLIFLLTVLSSDCRTDADVIYTRDYVLAGFLDGKNLILEIHDIPKRKKIFLAAAKRAKKIIAITDGLKEELTELGLSGGKILVAPDAVDLEKFNIAVTREEARQKINLPLDKKIVLYTGHLYEWKGADILAQAAQLLPEGAMTVFVGGVRSEETARFRQSWGSHSRIIIFPFQKRQLLPYFLKAADILVLSNRGGTEISEKYTSPLKLFEYMAAGRPIVASDLPSIREILNSGNAILVEPDNPAKLAQGIKSLLANGGLSQALAGRAFKDVQQYSWRKRVKKIIEFID